MESFLACHLLPIKIDYKAIMLHCGKVDNNLMAGVELTWKLLQPESNSKERWVLIY